MTTETIHTCSYSCERPGCIRAQRDELVARLAAVQAQPKRRYDPSGSLSEYGIFPECDAAPPLPEAVVEAVARAICVACEENPDRQGDASGNEFRWQDYRDAALAAISALATQQQEPTT